MDKERIIKATDTLKKYQEGKGNLNDRIRKNESYYGLLGYKYIDDANYKKDKFKTQSGWLFNSIANKHADFMDNYPQAHILPREANDKQEATTLTSVIPTILSNNKFKKTYSKVVLEKLKSGTGVYGVFWDTKKDNGLGDIVIRQIDIFNLAWEPNIKDIQDSRNLFYYRAEDTEVLKGLYPQLKEITGGGSIEVPEFSETYQGDRTDKTVVVDWYYKIIDESGVTKVHLCKYVGDTVIYSSEDEESTKEKGLYDHGLYPFVFDKLYDIANSPCGFGQIDIMRNPQDWIDILNQQIMVNAKWCSRPRFFARNDSTINMVDFADPSVDIVSTGGSDLGQDSLRQIPTTPMPNYVIEALDRKVNELKETSGNRDWSSGGTTSGVTAASAIAALQEAGSKLSRDMIQQSYGTFEELISIVIELMRQFYDDGRTFRITGESGLTEFVDYTNDGLNPPDRIIDDEIYSRKPVFDLDIIASKATLFTKVAHNEFIKELFAMGLFNPQLADQALVVLDMMMFDGKEDLLPKIAKNAQMPQMINDILNMAQAMDAITGKQEMLPAMMERYGDPEQNNRAEGTNDWKAYNAVSDDGSSDKTKGGIVNKAKQKSQNASAIK